MAEKVHHCVESIFFIAATAKKASVVAIVNPIRSGVVCHHPFYRHHSSPGVAFVFIVNVVSVQAVTSTARECMVLFSFSWSSFPKWGGHGGIRESIVVRIGIVLVLQRFL